jgi:hypothetical protein
MSYPKPQIFRSKRASIVAIWHQWKKDRAVWQDLAHALVDDLGFPGRAPVLVQDPDTLTLSVAAIEYIAGEPILPGWARAECDGLPVLVPDPRTITGRRSQDALRALRCPTDPRWLLPGMPPTIPPADPESPPAYAALECRHNGTALYVVWDQAPAADLIDLDLWREVPYAEYRQTAASEAGTP